MSIWPLITAVGLFLAFIGLMGLLPLTGFGLLIVFASLLWWTLGGKASGLLSQWRKLLDCYVC